MIEDSWCLDIRKNSIERCTDCEAKSLLFGLEELDTSTPEALERIKEALIWILENVDWPTN